MDFYLIEKLNNKMKQYEENEWFMQYSKWEGGECFSIYCKDYWWQDDGDAHLLCEMNYEEFVRWLNEE